MVVMERTEVVDMDTDDPGIRADRRLIPLEIKVTFAFTNAPQAQYLMHYVTIDAWSDGSDTLAGVKQKFADKEGVPVEHIKFMWMDEPIGRIYQGPHLPKKARGEEAKTMKQLNILGPDAWLHKFPHWRVLCATIAEDEKREALEEVHRAVATQIKGYEEGPELDRHIAQKRKTKKWNTLVFGAPTPYDPRYPETMPSTKRYTNCFDDDWDVDPEEEAQKARAKLRPKQTQPAKTAPQATKGGGVRAAAPEVEEETPRMSLEEVVAGVSKLSNKLVGSVVDVDAPLMEAGLDSLTSVELINELSGAFGVTLSPTVPYDYPTVRELSKHIRSII